MKARVTFNKPVYNPGDTVTASFELFSPYPSRTGEITLSLESGEKVGVDYTSYNGQITYTSTDWISTFYERTEIKFRPDLDFINEELTFKLPDIINQPIDTNKLKIFNRAKVKLDIKLSRDKSLEFPINVISSPLKPELSKEVPEKFSDFKLELDKTVVKSNNQLNVNIFAMKQDKFRNIIIEFRQTLRKWSSQHQEQSEIRKVLAELKGFYEFPKTVEVPGGLLSTNLGNNYEISHRIQVVFDRKLKRDINISENLIYDGTKEDFIESRIKKSFEKEL